MGDNIILIGFMGAGKTSVGQVLAAQTGMPLVDTDKMIEEEAAMSVSDIFAAHGEASFRETESAVLSKLLKRTDRVVVSAGGGLPLSEKNREMLKELGTVVFLKVKPETVLVRLEGDTTRPLLAGDHVEQKVRELLDYRNLLYEEAADIVIDADEKETGQLVTQICRELGL